MGRVKIIEPHTRYNKLIVIKEVEKITNNRRFLCKCDCGKKKIIDMRFFVNGYIKSCGCLLKEELKKNPHKLSHGHTKGHKTSPTYYSWLCMKKRCLDPKHKYYKNYGGRGITICKRWLDSFNNFLEDMGERPVKHTIDRINTNGNYDVANCRWATMKQQQNNRRNNKEICQR